MKTTFGKYILLITILLLITLGCSDPFEPLKPEKPAAETGYFSLTVNDPNAGRTIIPANMPGDFDAYTLEFVNAATDATLPVINRTAGDLSAPVLLNAGTWNLHVNAYLDDETEPAAQGSLAGIAIGPGAVVTRNVMLTPVAIASGGTGTFKWNIDYPANVTYAGMTITPLDAETGTAAQTRYFIGGTPSSGKNASLTLNTGCYRVVFSLINSGGLKAEQWQILHVYQNMESAFEYAFEESQFTKDIIVNSNADSGPGSLREALTNAPSGYTIIVDSSVGTIELKSRIAIDSSLNSKSLTIEGNGVTITRNREWTSGSSTQLLAVSNSSSEVNISRVHFKDARATGNGGAIYNSGGSLTFESCIFSGNLSDYGGVIYNSGTLDVKGCTFYGNSASSSGGVIYNGSSATVTLEGNLFYGNTAASYYPLVAYGTVTSNGYNVVDVTLGTTNSQSGWAADLTDQEISIMPVSPVSFRLIPDSEAADVITTLPTDYPDMDFYGDPISAPAAAGAVQTAISGSGFALELSVNNSSRGSVSASPEPNADGLVSGAVTITATPITGFQFGYWLKDGDTIDINDNPLSLLITAHTKVQAVFVSVVSVNNFTDASGSATTPGTLRHALTNADDGDIIRLIGVTPGQTVIELTSRLPAISRSIAIEGNGVTLSPAASMTVGGSSQMMNISGADSAVTISRIHFKDAWTTGSGGAIYKTGGDLTLESCIFSGNRSNYGGAIYNSGGTLDLKGCTFYGNSATSYGGAIYNNSGCTLTLTGNVFYGNTAGSNSPVVTTYGTQTSNGYNVVDIALGATSSQSGWAAGTGDKKIDAMPVSPVSFKLISGSEAANMMSALPEGYPTEDFYGTLITVPAASGAVQAVASGSGFALELSVNNSSRGSVSVSPEPNADGLVDGAVTITATPVAGFEFGYWLADGADIGSENPLDTILMNHARIKAVFVLVVTVDNFNDATGSATTPGTLRHALTNADDGDIIYLDGVTPGETVIELTGRLPSISKNITIEGNGITLTKAVSWTTANTSSQLMRLDSSAEVIISRIRFNNGDATDNGAAIDNRGNLTLESCIFSGNQGGPSGYGGAISNYGGTLSVKGCTFYGNEASSGGAIYNLSGILTLTGNLFYGNTGGTRPVVYSGTVTSNGYNVVDVALGTGINQSGWAAGTTGDLYYTSNPLSSLDTFAPAAGIGSVIPSKPAGFPVKDFYGDDRTFPGASGAVK